MDKTKMNTQIQIAAKGYADARADLAGIVADLNDEIEKIKRQALPVIKRRVEVAAARELDLRGIIEANPEDFINPRTVVLHGIKLGFRKGSGIIDWDDDAKVANLIEKHFSKPQAELLVKTTKKPIAKALADLDAVMLKKIGCRIETTGDIVIIKPADSDVDKIVTALLKGATEEKI